MVVHTAEVDRLRIAEAPVKGLRVVVPLPDVESRIAIRLQGLPYGFLLWRNDGALLLQGMQVFTGHQHRPAGHTDGSRSSPHNVGVRKERTVLGQRVEARRISFLDTSGMDRCTAHIVCQYQQDIGLLGRLCAGKERQQAESRTKYRFCSHVLGGIRL